MAVHFREATIDDADLVGALLHALDTHYIGARAPNALEAAAMVRDVIARREGTHFTVAFEDRTPVGLACWAVVRPGHRLAGGIFLKDLFVVEAARGQGIGEKLIGELAKFARAHRIGRLDLTTGRDNDGARRFYERLGGTIEPKVFYRFEGTVLERLAGAAE